MKFKYRSWSLALFFSAMVLMRCVHGADTTRPVAPLPPGIKSIEAANLHNVFAVGTNLFSGSSPESDRDFAALAKLGVKTIISVDGAKPPVELAGKHGLRYVHFPHGYDGINTNLQLQLSKAGESVAGPIYIHCHHGKHRGPTAAAVICMANNGWSATQAEQWLVAAGTATNYVGLYDVVRSFKKPTAEQLRAVRSSFPETARVSGLVDSMVQIDERWENLKSVRTAGYQVPKQHPDIKPANEALILWEHYREARRLPDSAHHGARFIDLLKTAESEAKEAERLLLQFARKSTPATRTQLDKTFDAMAKSCSACHKAYRDKAGIKGH